MAAAEQEFAINGFKGTSTSAIARRAGLAKAQVHYYFPSKEALYRELLRSIMDAWNCHLPGPETQQEPGEVLAGYINAKLRLSWERPALSKIFAGEVLRGAPLLREELFDRQREWLAQRTQLFQRWIEQGKMAPLDPTQLIFMIWAATQHYADYRAQVLAMMEQEELTETDFVTISEQVVAFLLRGCGVAPPAKS
nr:TetR/AcrR family transcriptional regulator [Motiliproteus sp. SC1-56]